MKYLPKIGLEIHIQLKTKTKMFCSCPNDPGEIKPNFLVCPICLGHPGILPTINEEAIKKVIKLGLVLNCKISEFSRFDRKNYFYPDLPKGYQISQYQHPLCKEGFLEIDGKKIRIKRIHLEEDTGKLLHHKDYSLIDFNRAGIPLLELVTEPDITLAKEAEKFAKELHLLCHYLDISDADMEKGEMRVEVNISLSQRENIMGTKVEIKNLNSFRSVVDAIDYEIKRQIKMLERGEKIVQETRGWDEMTKKTVSQREKEEAPDYRYFPEPDLPPLFIGQGLIEKIRAEIPELPAEKRKRFKKEYGLSEKTIEFFVYHQDLANYFEKVASELRNWIKEIELKRKVEEKEFFQLAKLASNYLLTDLWGLMKREKKEVKDLLVSAENFAEFISLIYEGKVSSRIGKEILEEMFFSGKDPSQIVEEKKLVQLVDEKEIEKFVQAVIEENQKAVLDFKKGKGGALQFLIGKVMAKTRGQANPEIVKEILEKKLKA